MIEPQFADSTANRTHITQVAKVGRVKACKNSGLGADVAQTAQAFGEAVGLPELEHGHIVSVCMGQIKATSTNRRAAKRPRKPGANGGTPLAPLLRAGFGRARANSAGDSAPPHKILLLVLCECFLGERGKFFEQWFLDGRNIEARLSLRSLLQPVGGLLETARIDAHRHEMQADMVLLDLYRAEE